MASHLDLLIKPHCVTPFEDVRRNIAETSRRAAVLPMARGVGHLAVVGGGPSIADNLDALRYWDGDIWAINGTCRHLRNLGVDATFFSVDAQPAVIELARDASRCVLHERCHYTIWDELVESHSGAEISIVRGPLPGPTSAVAATVAALDAGYRRVTMFGCEGSYTDDAHHAYDSYEANEILWIDCGGENWTTKPEFWLQTKQLAEVIRRLPQFYHERSGGLLRALIKSPEYQITHVSRNIFEKMRPATAEELAQ